MTEEPVGSDCLEAIQAQAYLEHVPFRIMLFVYVLFNFGCLLTNFFFLKHIFQRIFLPPHIKLLLKGQIWSNIVHGFFTLALSLSHLYLFFSASSGCQIIVTRTFCFFFKFPVDSAISCLITFTAALVCERFFATWKLSTFEKSPAPYGQVLGTVALVVGLLFGLFLNTRQDFTTRVPYCSSNSAQTLSASLLMASILFFVEISSIFMFIILRAVNFKRKKSIKFVVGLRYQLDENLDVFNIIWPWMLTHFTFIVIFYAFTIILPRIMDWSTSEMELRTLIGYGYLLPISFSTFSPLLMWFVFVWLQKKRRKRLVSLETRATGDQYYSSYTNMWQ